MSNIILQKNNSRKELLNNKRKTMRNLSLRARAPITTSKKICTVDQSEPGFCAEKWALENNQDKYPEKYFYWILKDEIDSFEDLYKKEFEETVFNVVLQEIEKYGSWIGFLS